MEEFERKLPDDCIPMKVETVLVVAIIKKSSSSVNGLTYNTDLVYSGLNLKAS